MRSNRVYALREQVAVLAVEGAQIQLGPAAAPLEVVGGEIPHAHVVAGRAEHQSHAP